ncbi:MAG: adenine-specific DNA-methyltransferase CcrM [Roseiflexaceae bacterium]
MGQQDSSVGGSAGHLPVNEIIQGDCVSILKTLPSASIDLIFADPPYYLQLRGPLRRPDQSQVAAVDDDWDRFTDFAHYDEFSREWLGECRRVLKDDGAIWVIGSYHNIFRVGAIMQDLGFWILNDVIWHKTNPMPNFLGTRFQNATETLIWARKAKDGPANTFNYHAMKHLNDEKQMSNVWYIPLCTGPERIKINGKKAHSTQKPEALLYRVLMASSKPGDLVLDPFFGTGTTGAVARKLQRHFIGIELEPDYIELARARLAALTAAPHEQRLLITNSKRNAPKVRFGQLIEAGYLRIGQQIFSRDRSASATIKADAQLRWGEQNGSIHRIAALAQGKAAFNGWEFWFYEDDQGGLHSIDHLRERYRAEQNRLDEPEGPGAAG